MRGLMRFPNSMLWNCHRLFVRKQLSCEQSRLKIWGYPHCNNNSSWLQKHHMTLVTCNKCFLHLFRIHLSFPRFVFLCTFLRDWKWQAVLLSSLNLRKKERFSHENRDLNLNWSVLISPPCRWINYCLLLCSPFSQVIVFYHSHCIQFFLKCI